jgi:MoxR-like ATPase
MVKTIAEAAHEAVRDAGGAMSEEEYLEQVQRNLHRSGSETSIDSLKANAFNSKRMGQAGVVRLTIGSARSGVKMVVSDDVAQAIADGNYAALGSAAADAMGSTAATETIIAAGELIASDTTHTASPVGNIIVGDVIDTTATSTIQGSINNTTEAATVRLEGGSWMGTPRRALPTESVAPLRIPNIRGVFKETSQGELKVISTAFQMGKHVLAEGPTGCGKTIAIYEAATQLNIPVIRVSCSDGIDEVGLVGRPTRVIDEATGQSVERWVDGPLPAAMRANGGRGGWLIVDEVNMGHPDVLAVLHAAMDLGEVWLTLSNTMERVEAGPDFRVFAAMNPDYAGTKELNEATRRRYGFIMEFDYLAEADEIEVIQKVSGVDNHEVAQGLVRIAGGLRQMKAEGQFSADCSTATLINTMEATTAMSLRDSVKFCFANVFSDSEERATVIDLARASLADY